MRFLRSALLGAAIIGCFTGVDAEGGTTAQIDAARDKGLAWLVSHQRGDGSWRSASGAEIAATSAAIDAFGAANVKTEPYAAGVAWLSNVTVVSVDSLARQIVTLSGAGLSVTKAAQTLVGWRNANRAWGAYEAFETTYPDTALALAAIRAARYAYTDAELKAARCRMLVSQKTSPDDAGGSWSYTHSDENGPMDAPAAVTGSAILPTVYNILEIDAIRQEKGPSWASVGNCSGAPWTNPSYNLATAVTSGLTWLTARKQNPDGGFGDGGTSTVLETALAYQALATLAPNDPAVGPALDYLVLGALKADGTRSRTQGPDGSWNGDPFQTALVLRVIPLGTPYADTDPDLDGLPDRLETQLQTNPTQSDSRWMAPGNGLTASAPPTAGEPPTAANDFGIIRTGVSSPDDAGRRTPRPSGAAALLRVPRASGPGARDPQLPDPLALTVSTEAFRVDLYTGSAVAELPIAVPRGAGGVAPSIVLRYDSVSADAPSAIDPGPGTGLGWTLATGPVIVRDHKGTTATSDDTFTLVMGPRRDDLVLIDSAQGISHTQDEAFLKLQYDAGSDHWTLTTKDGTRYDLGSTTASKQSTLVAAPWTTSVTYRYFVNAVTTTSGVTITYAYSKDTATVSGQAYDQSIYLDSITWASVGGVTLGTARHVTFVRSPRTDWPLSPSTPKHFEAKKLDAVEVRIGASLVRKYGLTYDYTSIDRTPGTAWDGGGATGDLALKTVTLYGTDGATALPTATFGYDSASGRLATAANGLGGQVSYGYETLATAAFYSVCTTSSCTDYGVCSDPNPAGYPVAPLLGYLLSASQAEAVPVYSVCKTVGPYGGCADWGVGTEPSGGGWTLLGYAFTTALPQVPGTLGLYSVNQGGWKAVVASAPPAGGTLLGYVYPVDPSRYARTASRAVSDGRTPTSTTTYTHSALALNPDGSVRGYASAQATDPAGTYTNTYFKQDDGTSGRIYQADTYSGTTLLRRTVNTWTVTTPYPATAPAVRLATLPQSDVTAYDGGVAITTRRTWQYDAYANVTVARSEGDLAVTGDEREERTDWLVDGTKWIHRPSRVALYNGTGAVVRERWHSYDDLAWGALGTRGLATQEERRLTGPLGTVGNAIITTGYDAYGNVASTTDPGDCQTTTAYDPPTYALPSSITKCLDHVTIVGHDEYARRTSVKDPNNQITTYGFDKVGRLEKVTGPLDTVSPNGSVTYLYLNWGSPASQVVRTLRTKFHGEAATTWSDEYFDGRGRGYALRSSGPGAGQVIAQGREFNSRGWVAQRSAAHVLNVENPVWTAYTYDPLGRVTQVQYPDTTMLTTVYGAVSGVGSLATVTDERNNPKRFYHDAYGQLVEVEEINSTTVATTYAYDAAGNLTTVTYGVGGAVTTLGYDALGRRTSLSDPNLGDWSWGYDTRGNLTSQADARNQTATTVTFAYDLQGRVTSKSYQGGGQVVWTYDEPNAAAPYTKGRLTTLTDLVSTTTYTYDQVGRVTRASRILDGTTYVLQQGYDAVRHVVSRTFPVPDGEAVSYVYNDAGWLERIPGYVEAPGNAAGILYNARGQRTQVSFANGVSTAYTYHPTNFRLTRLLTLAPGGTLQDFSYGYDAAGNLAQVIDSVGSGSRTFVYDALNRLIRASGWFGSVTEDYAYDVTGNLLRRASLVYAYSDADHPWAVTAVTDGRSYAYDANGNATTAGGRTLVWDADAQLQSVASGGTSVAIAYDALGHRVLTTTPSGVTRSPFPGYEVDVNGVSRKSLGLAGKQGGRVSFYHDDLLGSTHVVTDANGLEAQRVEYNPWGQVTRSAGTTDARVRFRTAEAAGGERERHYDPALGRMLSAEPRVADLVNPQALNPYAYAVNNPTSPTLRRPDGGAPEF